MTVSRETVTYEIEDILLGLQRQMVARRQGGTPAPMFRAVYELVFLSTR